MARAKRESIHYLFRLLLIPLFAIWLRLFRAFDFLFLLGASPLSEYAWNIAVLCACAGGFVMLALSSPRRRALTGAGLVLALSPLWISCGYHMGEAGAAALDFPRDFFSLSTLARAGAALWGLLMVRGPRGREWGRAFAMLVLIARAAALALWREGALAWFDDAMAIGCAILLGAALDCLYRGPCLPDLLVPLLACGWLPVLIFYPALDIRIALFAEIALCLVGITALACARPVKRGYMGYLYALLGALINAAMILATEGALL